jgi:S-formylglutathione hydrolase
MSKADKRFALEQIAANKCFGGQQLRYRHRSPTLDCAMTFSVYLPPQAEQQSVPVLYWLSGLTCTDENFVNKAGAQRWGAQHGLAIVCPDTSPRGDNVPADPAGGWDFGLGAGFYLNASQPPWSRHYRMYDYVVSELPALLAQNFPLDTARASISGHSMGGHGALTIALKNPQRYRSASAFSPVCAPMQCPWGQKAFGHYLGSDQSQWREHDTTELLRGNPVALPMRVDQGDADGFLETQLKTDLLARACEETGYAIDIRMQAGYDHSYFFIASFIEEHIRFHAGHL